MSAPTDTQQILGCYTLSAVAVSHASLTGRARRHAPDPVPAVLLGRLADARKLLDSS